MTVLSHRLIEKNHLHENENNQACLRLLAHFNWCMCVCVCVVGIYFRILLVCNEARYWMKVIGWGLLRGSHSRTSVGQKTTAW